jgi:geranylgeranyl diphosphate synthase type I
MIASADLDARLEQLSSEVDAWTRSIFERHRPSAERFAGMLSYPLGWVDSNLRSLDPPAPAGKRLRPALCLLVCEAVGGDHRPALAAAAAVELIHNFSLVHDDIQDESLLRRGRPTVWAQWQTAQAINVGDSLFALGQLALLQDPAASPELLVGSAARLSVTCLRLVEGQYLDLELQSFGSASLKAYQTMIAGKTAALLECSAWLGARFGGVGTERAERFAGFGRELGLAFQYHDDLLGVWGDPALTGKSSDADLRSRKQALPAVLALQATGPAADRFREAFTRVGEMSARDLRTARAALETLNIRRQVEQMMDEGYRRAETYLRSALGERPDSALCALVRYFRERAS